ncbi:MAG: hypothetical protein HQL47_09700 [Gammaproteobacteria bacterium]|nr:hypothetical protein [Gammaproteobacteria bacterium]
MGQEAEPNPAGPDQALDYPPSLTPAERRKAAQMLSRVPAQAQDLLDELAALIQAERIRVSPLSCLRGLVDRAVLGTFALEAGAGIQAQREARQRQARRVEAPPDNDAILAQHARLMGLSLEEYRQRLGGRA